MLLAIECMIALYNFLHLLYCQHNIKTQSSILCRIPPEIRKRVESLCQNIKILLKVLKKDIY